MVHPNSFSQTSFVTNLILLQLGVCAVTSLIGRLVHREHRDFASFMSALRALKPVPYMKVLAEPLPEEHACQRLHHEPGEGTPSHDAVLPRLQDAEEEGQGEGPQPSTGGALICTCGVSGACW